MPGTSEGQQKASDPLGTRITDGYEPSCGCWRLNLGPLKEQQVLLTPEPSFQPWKQLCFVFPDRAFLSWNLLWPQTQIFAYFCLPIAGNKGVCHHCLAKKVIITRYRVSFWGDESVLGLI